MYCARPVSRSPSVYRIIKPCTAGAARNASFFPQPFFPRSTGNEFAPFLRLLDDFANAKPFDLAPTFSHQTRLTPTFQPRFDVREVGETYELRGEIPGVDSKDLEVEFTDPQTLIVRGRTEREYSSGTPPAVEGTETAKAVTNEAATEAQTEPAAQESDKDDAASTYSTGSYQRPTVEDAEGAAESSTDAQATPTSTVATQAPAAEQPAQQPEQPQARYWVSERSTGSFQRVFNFGSRIDQDAVTASLKNGILSIVVPKAAAPAARRINVE